MAEATTGGLSGLFPNLHLCLTTRTWLLMAEIRDLKMGTAANHPVSGFPWSSASPSWVGT